MEPSQTARLSCSASFKAPGGSKMTKDLSDQGRLRYPKPHRRLERFFWSLVSGLWSLVSVHLEAGGHARVAQGKLESCWQLGHDLRLIAEGSCISQCHCLCITMTTD
jgi:hypothetical protein